MLHTCLKHLSSHCVSYKTWALVVRLLVICALFIRPPRLLSLSSTPSFCSGDHLMSCSSWILTMFALGLITTSYVVWKAMSQVLIQRTTPTQASRSLTDSTSSGRVSLSPFSSSAETNWDSFLGTSTELCLPAMAHFIIITITCLLNCKGNSLRVETLFIL